LLPDETLLKIAKKNALTEMAKNIHLRWFTLDIEMVRNENILSSCNGLFRLIIRPRPFLCFALYTLIIKITLVLYEIN